MCGCTHFKAIKMYHSIIFAERNNELLINSNGHAVLF